MRIDKIYGAQDRNKQLVALEEWRYEHRDRRRDKAILAFNDPSIESLYEYYSYWSHLTTIPFKYIVRLWIYTTFCNRRTYYKISFTKKFVKRWPRIRSNKVLYAATYILEIIRKYV